MHSCPLLKSKILRSRPCSPETPPRQQGGTTLRRSVLTAAGPVPAKLLVLARSVDVSSPIATLGNLFSPA
jgi:hypothetical protein